MSGEEEREQEWRKAFVDEVLVEVRRAVAAGGGGNGWQEHKLYVREELKRLADGQKEILDCQAAIKTEVALKAEAKDLEQHKSHVATQFASLKAKVGLWGAVGASIPSAAGILYVIFNK